MATKTKKQEKNGFGAKIKTVVKNYGTSMKTAYNVGYTDGWAAATKLPNKTGTRAAAVKGYGDGIHNRRQVNNSNRKHEKAKT